ncbi:MAG: Crp/Fnr family transcriptional regulator [Firmicutes bacterium]|nr:Crp/Fnr family transcriptional regulator [Bacillota bacterium]
MTYLFENINEKNLLKLKRILNANTVTYRKNVNILSNVKRDDFIAIIDSGSVQLVFNDYDGNKTIIEDINEGGIFGSITSSIYNEEVSCITKEETQVTYIEYNEITNDEIIKTDSYIIFIKNLIKILSEQVSDKNSRIELLTKKTTRDKLLEYFKIKSQERGNKTFTIPISFTELANYLSVDRSAMTREIGYLKEEGFIKTSGRKITLLY